MESWNTIHDIEDTLACFVKLPNCKARAIVERAEDPIERRIWRGSYERVRVRTVKRKPIPRRVKAKACPRKIKRKSAASNAKSPQSQAEKVLGKEKRTEAMMLEYKPLNAARECGVTFFSNK
jgi:hypothetical protein